MRKKSLSTLICSICLVLVFAVSVLAQPSTARKNYLVASTSAASGSYPHVVKAADIWSKKTPYNFTVVETGAAYDNLERIRRGELMIGYLVTVVGCHEAYMGIGHYKGEKPFPKMRVLFNYSIPPIYWSVRQDSGVTNIEQLSGKRFGAGIAGASSTAMVFHTFKVFGMDASRLEAGSTADQVNAVIDNRLIGLNKTSGNVQLDSSLLTIQASVPTRILSMTEQQWTKFDASDPLHQWVRFDLPANTLTSHPGHGPIITHGFIVSVAGTSDIPQETGYAIMKASVESWKEWGSLYRATLFFDPIKDQLKGWPQAPHVPLHAGTVQYLKEKGVDIPQRFIPPEYKGK